MKTKGLKYGQGKAWELNVTPMGKPRMTQRDRWANRPVILNWYAYKDALKLEATMAGFEPVDNMEIFFMLPMPNSWSKKKKDRMFGSAHTQTPDIDNLLKGFLDALLIQDNFIANITVHKVWANSGMIQVFTKK